MNFRLNEDQQQLQGTIARILAADRIQPRTRAVIDGKKKWDEETWQELIDFGLTGIVVPEENGGMGMSLIELALCAEELGRSAAAVPFLGHALATIAIVEGGSDEQKAKYLPGLASGEVRQQLVVPYTLDANDMRFGTPQGFNTGEQFFTYLRDSFDQLWEEGAQRPAMMSVGMHCRLLGRPGRFLALRRFLDHVQAHERVWICRRIDIARHWKQHFPAPSGGA